MGNGTKIHMCGPYYTENQTKSSSGTTKSIGGIWDLTEHTACVFEISVVSRSLLKGTEPFLRPKVPFVMTQNTPCTPLQMINVHQCGLPCLLYIIIIYIHFFVNKYTNIHYMLYPSKMFHTYIKVPFFILILGTTLTTV